MVRAFGAAPTQNVERPCGIAPSLAVPRAWELRRGSFRQYCGEAVKNHRVCTPAVPKNRSALARWTVVLPVGRASCSEISRVPLESRRRGSGEEGRKEAKWYERTTRTLVAGVAHRRAGKAAEVIARR
ncbi:hypothetical protein KM043_004215 [Ampulex compressa]|nr:hypothetical protein KM043_004215 [Ampulex compressa]